MCAATVIKKIKDAVKAKGLNLTVMSKTFQEVDTNHDGCLDLDGEFPKLIKALGIKLTSREEKILGKAVDPDEQEKVTIANFLAFFAPDIPKPRLKVVEACFKLLCPEGKEISIEALRERFGAGEFTVIGGRRVKTEQLMNDFSKHFDSDQDGVIAKADFILYYTSVSESISSDDEFKAILEASWSF
jgi:Ca2+-binding EF-hand superfamily protein